MNFIIDITYNNFGNDLMLGYHGGSGYQICWQEKEVNKADEIRRHHWEKGVSQLLNLSFAFNFSTKM